MTFKPGAPVTRPSPYPLAVVTAWNTSKARRCRDWPHLRRRRLARPTGWANPDLTEAGERDAVHAGWLPGAQGLLPRHRAHLAAAAAIHSADLALAACDRDWVTAGRVISRRRGAAAAVLARPHRITAGTFGPASRARATAE